MDYILNNSSIENIGTEDLPNGIEYYGMSLVLESSTELRLYFKVDESVDASLYSFTDNKDNYYYIEIGMNPSKIMISHDFSLFHMENYNCWYLNRSVLQYARLVFEDDTASESLKNLCKALILYGNAGYGYSYDTYLLS